MIFFYKIEKRFLIQFVYNVLNAYIRIVEKNPTKFKIDNKELTVQRSFIEQAREEVKVI